ncbi:MAG: hypothetical protein KGQ89_03525 [Verrucomicrobia bacterium]|nr:hypothetical protein [Verrucomicrobiota bacterium]
MTPTSYYIASIARSFGYQRRNKRLSDASTEMGLLREAEFQLGQYLWEKIEPIEDLSVEYWNLRKLTVEQKQVRAKLAELNATVESLMVQRSAIVNDVSQEQSEYENKRSNFLLYLEELAYERDNVIHRAKELRRAHEGMLTKIEVIQSDGHPPEEIAKVESAIENLKSEFRTLKTRRQEIIKEIEEGDRLIDVIDSKLAEYKQEKRDRASVVFQQMGELNRDLSLTRSQIGTIELQIHQLQSEVGRYLSRYAKRNPICAKIAMEQRTMVEVMRLLRISIAMNNKLAGFK